MDWLTQAKQFIAVHGTDNGPLNGRSGGPDNKFLRRRLADFTGKPVSETDDLYSALLAVRELTRWRYCVVAHGPYEFSPKPSAQLTSVERFMDAFKNKTRTPDAFMPLIEHVYELWHPNSKIGIIPLPTPEPVWV